MSKQQTCVPQELCDEAFKAIDSLTPENCFGTPTEAQKAMTALEVARAYYASKSDRRTAELERRIKQLERWLNDAANEVGECDLDSVASEIRKSRAELERRVRELAKECGQAQAYGEMLGKQSAERRVWELERALGRYGLHEEGCPAYHERGRGRIWQDGDEKLCTCGLAAALEKEAAQ